MNENEYNTVDKINQETVKNEANLLKSTLFNADKRKSKIDFMNYSKRRKTDIGILTDVGNNKPDKYENFVKSFNPNNLKGLISPNTSNLENSNFSFKNSLENNENNMTKNSSNYPKKYSMDNQIFKNNLKMEKEILEKDEQNIVNNIQKQNNSQNNQNNQYNQELNHQKKISESSSSDDDSSNDSDKDSFDLRLTQTSKYLMVLRVFILFVTFIFIPFEALSSVSLDYIEMKTLYKFINKIITNEVIENFWFKSGIKVFNILFLNMDSLYIYSSFVYILFHPFRAVKIVFSLCICSYFLVLMRLLYQAARPFWYIKQEVVECNLSYANPSLTTFNSLFFISLLLIQYAENYKKIIDNKISIRQRMIYFFVFLLIIIINITIHLISKTNFLYQQLFGIVICLVMLVITMDLDTTVHNFLLDLFKTRFKIRKFKIYAIILSISFFIVACLLYSIVVDKITILTVQNLVFTKSCKDDIFLLGKEKTILDSSCIFSITGVIWGAGYTVENNVSKWWNSNIKHSILKILLIVFLSSAYFISLNLLIGIIPNFELIFVIECIKSFFYFYLSFAFFPILFKAFHLNEVEPDLTEELESSENINDMGENDITSNRKNHNSFYDKDKDFNENDDNDSYNLEGEENDIDMNHVNKEKTDKKENDHSPTRKNKFGTNRKTFKKSKINSSSILTESIDAKIGNFFALENVYNKEIKEENSETSSNLSNKSVKSTKLKQNDINDNLRLKTNSKSFLNKDLISINKLKKSIKNDEDENCVEFDDFYYDHNKKKSNEKKSDEKNKSNSIDPKKSYSNNFETSDSKKNLFVSSKINLKGQFENVNNNEINSKQEEDIPATLDSYKFIRKENQ